MQSRTEAAMKLRDFFQRLGEARVARGGVKTSALLARFVFSAYPYLFLIGLLSAYVFCAAVSGAIASRLMSEQTALAEALSRRAPSPFASQDGKKSQTDMDFAAFGVADSNPASAVKEEVAEAKPIDSFTVVGTLPKIGAWINVDGASSLVLKEQELGGYVLENIDRGGVVFTRDGERFPLFLSLSGSKTASSSPPAPQSPPPPAASAQAAPSSIASAEFNGNEGTLTREILNDLIANPMQVLSTIRLRPDAQGMRVDRVRSDNLLARLGIKQGDLLTGINGIPINSGTDILNVMKSLLQGSRFDLQMNRGQESGMLRYSVR